MPHKLHCYVLKGASRKAQKGTPSLPCDEDASHNAVVHTDELLSLCTDVEVQTDEICLLSVDAEIQTDVYMSSRVDVVVQTDEHPLFTDDFRLSVRMYLHNIKFFYCLI